MDRQLMRELIQALMQGRHVVTTVLHDKDLSLAEFIALTCVAGNRDDSEDKVYADDLQSRLFISKPAISQLLKSLEKAGYIQREINLENRRKLNVTLTPQGREVLTDAMARYEGALAKIINTFGVEKTRQMIALNSEFLAVTKQTLHEEA